MQKKCPLLKLLMLPLIVILLAGAASPQKKQLTYKQVFQRGEPRLLGQLPRIVRWLDAEHYLVLRSDPNDEKAPPQLLHVNAITGDEGIYFDETKFKDKLPSNFSLQRAIARTPDLTRFVFDHQNDLYYFSTETESFKQLTASPAPEKNPTFSPNGQLLAYTRNNNLYVLELESGLERQLTSDGSDVIYNGWASWVYYEEVLGRSSNYAAFWWAPNSEMIAFLRFDDSPVPTFPLYRADGVHGELEITRYPKAGDPNPYVKLGIYSLKDKRLVWVDTEDKADHYIAWPFWTPDSRQLFFQWLNRGQDHLKIFAADPATGKKLEIYDEQQPSWVDFFTDIYFLEDGSGFLLRSDKDGYAHLYYHDMTGKLKLRLTSGSWEVRNIVLVDEKNRQIFFEASKNRSTENHLFRIGFDGKGETQLTKVAGTHNCMVSPEGKYFIDTYSNIAQPSRMELYDAKGNLIRSLGDQRLPIMDEYDLGRVELFTIPSGDGYDLPAVWILPPNFDPSKKYPVVFQIYGGPASASVNNSFKGLSWHFYAQHGIIVISVDHRGSGHFGKKGVALMHRNFGKWEMNDLIAAVKWLRNQPFIDPQRIGITGGSYGGYVTCMALTYGADYFTHGIAEYSVTDFRLYDSIYTERYMDTPAENPKGYEFASALNHADKYKGYLLITHGTMDDNVHMQNTIQLIDKLQDLNRDFELMVYPNARHGVGFSKRNHAIRENVQFWFRHFLGQELTLEELSQ
ncbi:MAG: S9 family peptidase [candidate division KSB1 bacterium]|nr:S9 family peptidase [candidate division KSB1 bacterium]MDZ7318776.1 S9 family peptidase [candidate division KSB1 bacterium]